MEVQSDRDGFTDKIIGNIYLTVLHPKSVKGYHIHAVASYHVTCLKGTVRSTVYRSRTEKETIEYGDNNFITIKYPPGCAHLIENLGDEPAYVIIYRYPAWSRDLPEQLDVPPEEIETEATWENIQQFISRFS
ncbi:MAG: hypothetical protein AAB420_00720 [Patescibacteria group bacterium]